jgi:hypothetical protein
VLLKLVLAALVFAHGAIHVSYLAPRPPATADGPAWPFSLARSGILSPIGAGSGVTRSIGSALVIATLAAFTLAAACVLGLTPAALWPAAVAAGAGSSIAVLLLFFHPWLVLGLLIDVGLLAIVLMSGWSPDALGA